MRRLLILAPTTLTVLALAACGSTASASPSASATAGSDAISTAAVDAGSCGSTVAELAASAKKEGAINLIALPDTWANYKGVLASYTDIYGVKTTVANPDASSADEVTAITTLRGQAGQPEVVDVGPSFTSQLISQGYADTFKPSTWDQIPADLKDPNGKWVGAYYGLMSIGVNTTLVKDAPTTWADLLKPEYKGQVTLNGDPREAGAAFAAVMAASLANGGSFDDITPGIAYFAKLKAEGNLQTVDVTEANLLSGEVPIALDWTYNFPAVEKSMKDAGFDLTSTVPSDGVYASYYAQSVVTQAAHPCAAKAFVEHLTSDAGALAYLEGGAIPARYATLVKEGKVSADLAAKLPDAKTIAGITFPTQAQIDAAKAVLATQWGPQVADK
ncbi:ABC transporter substrate-binding protein [Cellulomonas citrea]|uniref:ABC transporter substrate-binding protein n=1 Tax=Cellulomonas citrea TaxID=1909423 RepID=UPI00135B14DA|nr:ABC transporter substrate-binding protein [Cellulomonas citrea]